MATARALRAAVLCCLLVGSPGFHLRKRSVPWRGAGELHDALGFVRQERRRLDDERSPGYYWNQEEVISENPERMLLADLLSREGTQAFDDSYYQGPPVDFRAFEKPADLTELENILSDDTTDEEDEDKEDDKRRIPYQIGGPKTDPRSDKREYDPSSLKADDDKRALSEDEVADLLAEEDESVGVPATDEEIAAAIGEDMGVDEESDEATDEPSDSDLNKESMDNYATKGLIAQKSKRSGHVEPLSQGDSDDQAELAREYIKTFLELEDDENTNLANALNLATLSQVEKSDQYVQREADFIKQAIEDEEEIQTLKETLKQDGSSGDVRAGGRNDDSDDLGPPLLRKRMYPEDMSEEDPELEEEEEEEIPDENDSDDLADAELRAYLAAKLRQYLLRTPAYGDNDISQPLDDAGEWYDGPVQEDVEGVSVEDLYLNPFWRKILNEYRAGQVRKRGEPPDSEEFLDDEVPMEEYEEEDEMLPEEATEDEIEDTLENYVSRLQPWQQEIANEVDQELADAEMCPSLDLVDDCKIAHILGLRLDQEALDLCNRHQLCYTCGAVHDLESVHCDVEYRDDASRLCMYEDDTTKCRRDAVIFLELLKEHHPFFTPEIAPDACFTPCTKDWIYGL